MSFHFPLPLSIPYPTTPQPRHYGPITANTNFCEEDHQFSSRVAELINTASNVTYIIYALHGLRLLSRRDKLTFQTALPHIGIMLVGIASAAYHSTLLKVPQLADEIAMAVPTGAVVCRLVSFRIADPRRRAAAYYGMLSAIVAVYGLHVVFFLNWIHYPAFGVMVFYVGRRCIHLIRTNIPDPGLRRRIRHRAWQGEVLFLGAFALWLVDRFCCGALRGVRETLGLPWGWVTELHGWWHVGTGMGAYAFVQVAEYMMEDGGGVKTVDPGKRLDPFYVRLWGGMEDQEVVGGDGGAKGKKVVNGAKAKVKKQR